MSDLADTIVAPITGTGRAPVAVLRVSGPNAWEIAVQLFNSQPSEPRLAYYGTISDIDDGFVILFEEGHSYTGEESFEVSCHGSPEIVRRVISAIVSLGARPAKPGEFTERAFLNGRIDLTQAEAVRETIEASTDAQLRRSAMLKTGHLARKIGELGDRVARELAWVEATVDFSEEVGQLDRPAAVTSLNAIVADIDVLLSGFETGRLIRHGLRVAIIGRPNVGKSSLLNALLGIDRAIVSDIPGTTRDTIEESVSISGYPVVLTDTAGIREASDAVEKIGVERSRAAIESADQIWLVFESPAGWTEEDQEIYSLLPGREPDVLIANKLDLGRARANTPRRKSITLSALTGEGLDHLAAHIRQTFEIGNAELPLINERHREDLAEARQSLNHAIEALESDLPQDIACVDLHGALATLGRITGETAPDEIIARVFSEFCIGK